MIVFFTFLLMLLSSIYLTLYFNHLTELNEKETKRVSIESKFRKPLEDAKLEDIEKHVFVEAC
jgi:dolichyl-phosphate-mannose--protein O-mannosyl transferase